MDMSLDKAEAAMVAKELKQILLDAVPLSCNLPRVTLPNYDNIPGNLMLSSLGLKLGDRVVLDDMKVSGKHRRKLNMQKPRHSVEDSTSYWPAVRLSLLFLKDKNLHQFHFNSICFH